MKALCLLVLSALCLPAQVLNIGVFTLFRPTELRVESTGGSLVMTGGDVPVSLEGRQGAGIRLSERGIACHSERNSMTAPAIRVTGRDGSASDFTLAIPGKIRRQFHGILTVRGGDHHLQAVVAMDLESAVASVVAAESQPGTPLEALKAQAVVTRSYYVASQARHDGFDFCDTTHCQFLQERPASSALAARATHETRGLVLTYGGRPFAALYSASCGGRTRALDNAGSGYPYFAVMCDYCRRHRRGVVEGHQLGLCQRGAAGMAVRGARWREILEHYYPGTAVRNQLTGTMGEY